MSRQPATYYVGKTLDFKSSADFIYNFVLKLLSDAANYRMCTHPIYVDESVFLNSCVCGNTSETHRWQKGGTCFRVVEIGPDKLYLE